MKLQGRCESISDLLLRPHIEYGRGIKLEEVALIICVMKGEQVEVRLTFRCRVEKRPRVHIRADLLQEMSC
jgi:hypothetical protein